MWPLRRFEPGGHPAELIMVLKQQHGSSLASERVGRRQPGKAAADDNDVVVIFRIFQKIFRHNSTEYCRTTNVQIRT